MSEQSFPSLRHPKEPGRAKETDGSIRRAGDFTGEALSEDRLGGGGQMRERCQEQVQPSGRAEYITVPGWRIGLFRYKHHF